MQLQVSDEDFADKLVKWAGHYQKTFLDGGDEIIATRRLVHIVKAYSCLW